jgi:DNA-binding NtrC family response regulator
MLKSYDFPGNVRELKNLMERAIILSKGNPIGIKDFPLKTKSKSEATDETANLNLEENEVELIRLALHNCGNNQNAAAKALGIQRMALARKMQKYNISLVFSKDRK